MCGMWMWDSVGFIFFFFSSRRRHTRYWRDWSSDVCSSDLLDDLPELVKMCTGCSLCWDFCPRGGLQYEATWKLDLAHQNGENGSNGSGENGSAREGGFITGTGEARSVEGIGRVQIGRASCRERGEISVVAVS